MKEEEKVSRSSINCESQVERNYWSRKWGVTEKQLEEALQQVRSREIEKVRSYLENHRYMT